MLDGWIADGGAAEPWTQAGWRPRRPGPRCRTRAPRGGIVRPGALLDVDGTAAGVHPGGRRRAGSSRSAWPAGSGGREAHGAMGVVLQRGGDDVPVARGDVARGPPRGSVGSRRRAARRARVRGDRRGDGRAGEHLLRNEDLAWMQRRCCGRAASPTPSPPTSAPSRPPDAGHRRPRRAPGARSAPSQGTWRCVRSRARRRRRALRRVRGLRPRFVVAPRRRSSRHGPRARALLAPRSCSHTASPTPWHASPSASLLARRLLRDGFEATVFEGVTELPEGVRVVGRAHEDAIVAVGLLPKAPWAVPYSDATPWDLGDTPRVISLDPGLAVKLVAAQPPGVPRRSGAPSSSATSSGPDRAQRARPRSFRGVGGLRAARTATSRVVVIMSTQFNESICVFVIDARSFTTIN